MTRISGTAAPDVSRWERERRVQEPRAARMIHTELAPHANAEAVAKLSGRRSESALGRRLDDFIRQLTPTYQIDGRSVRVTAPFRSRFGESDAQTARVVEAFKKKVGDQKFAEIALRARYASSSRGTPEDIRVATQALIDAGAVREMRALNPKLSTEAAVEETMKAFRIGLDCRGYVYRAFLYARGTGSVSAKGSAYFDGGEGDARFHQMPARLRKLDASAARTGDIFRLAPGGDGRDHNLIVRSNELREVPRDGKVTVAGRQVPPSFVSDGWRRDEMPRVRVFTVDSSWGSTGPRRDVWLYNERTKTWGEWDDSGVFVQSSKGPYNHEVDGVYRARSES